MSAAAARSKSVRLALALAGVLIALGALSWWMSDSQDQTANVSIETTARSIEAHATELEAASNESAGPHETSTRKVEEPPAVVDAATPAAVDWGRLIVTVRSSAPRPSVTKGTAQLTPRRLRTLRNMSDVDLAQLNLNGRAVFDRVAFGEWMLVVEADDFDRAEQLVTIENGALVNLEITVEPLVPAELAVVLRHPNGIPLFDAVEGGELETAKTLRPVFLVECPKTGADLSPDARHLAQRSRFMSEAHPDQWMHVTFKQPVAGCACAVLGNRVLDAVPFLAGQEVVVLSVSPETLRSARASLLVRVRDAALDTPLANVPVTVKDGFGGERRVVTDALGTAVANDLPPTDVSLIVDDNRYMRTARVVSLSPGVQTEAPPFLLERSTSIRGTVTWPAAAKPVKLIMLIRTKPAWSYPATVVPDASGTRGTFTFLALPADEYLVGFASGPPYATLESVRSGEKRAWKIVDTRAGNVDDVVIDVPQELLDLAGNQR